MDENTNIQIILQSMDTQIKTGFHGYDKDSTKEYINGLITNSKSEINGLNKIIDDLRNNNGRLKAELEEAVANYNNLLNKKEDPSKDIEIKKLKKEIEELQSELNKVQIKDSNTTSLHDENLELKNIVASQDDELNELKTHVSLLNKKIKELNNETKTKELENATKNVKLEKDFRALQADYEIVKKQLDVANDRIKSYTEQLDSGEINKLREALDASNKQVEQMTEMVKDEDGDKPTVGQFQQQSMNPYTEQLRMAAAMFSGETGLTLDDLGFVTDNPSSAEAIKAAHENLRLIARKAQRTYGTAFANVGYVAASLRDDMPYSRELLTECKAIWEPVFEPDAAMLSNIGDGAIKLNQAVPNYINTDNLRKLTGIEASEEVVEVEPLEEGIEE